MNDELPKGWASTTGRDLFRWSSGKFLPKARMQAGEFPVYGGNGISGTHAEAFVSHETLVIGRVGAQCGNVHRTLGKAWVTDNAIFAAWISPAVNLSFVHHFFQASNLNANAGGSGQPFVNQGVLDALAVALPPLAEQNRIVEMVDALLAPVNRAKERLDRVRLILKRFRQAVLAAACSGELTRDWRDDHSGDIADRRSGLLERRAALWESRQQPKAARGRKCPAPFVPDEPFELPAGWQWVSVSHLALLDVGFAFKSAEFVDRGVRLLRGENIEPGSLRWTETRCLPESKVDPGRHFFVDEGDIILGMDRPIVSAGLKIARVQSSDVPALLVQRVMRFKLVDAQDADYLHYCLSDSRFIAFLAHDGMTGSDLPHITGTGVAEFPIPLPPTAEQTEIVRQVNALFAVADAVERRVEAATARANKLPQAILSKAFSGELVPTEAELARAEGRTYETAEELLARVRGASAGSASSGQTKRARQPKRERSTSSRAE